MNKSPELCTYHDFIGMVTLMLLVLKSSCETLQNKEISTALVFLRLCVWFFSLVY